MGCIVGLGSVAHNSDNRGSCFWHCDDLPRIAADQSFGRRGTHHIHHRTARVAALIGIVGLLLAILHGMEASIWAAAYLWLGAVGSQSDAMLYSLDSFTTRGESGLVLGGDWRLMGALEAANGMLLFGISTAFVFTVIQRIVTIIDKPGID